MTGSQPMEQLDDYEEDDEFFQEVERRVQQNNYPSLEEAKMGVIVGKYVKGFIEERGMKVVNEDVADLDRASFGILPVEIEACF
ncbi:hypothetical protein MMC31_004520 [Peltigera leucophlebia]|nr:hypothetical protein [Peltigera leucophlebia]